MSTITPFVQPVAAPFQFQPTLDGTAYTATVTWNLWGQRYYLTITDLQGNVILCIALIGSIATASFNLVGGVFFTSTLIYDVSNKTFVVTP